MLCDMKQQDKTKQNIQIIKIINEKNLFHPWRDRKNIVCFSHGRVKIPEQCFNAR